MFKSVNGVKPPIQRGILGISVENVRIRVQQISYLVLFVIMFLFRTLKDLRNWISSFSYDLKIFVCVLLSYENKNDILLSYPLVPPISLSETRVILP